MVIYSKEEKTLIIPEGLGYEPEQQYEKGYDNGFNEGFKEGSGGEYIEISMDYYLNDTAFLYLPNWYHSVVMNSFEFYCDEWWYAPDFFSHKHCIKAIAGVTSIPDSFTFTYFCFTNKGSTNPLPTADNFDNLVINGNSYTIEDVFFESAGGNNIADYWNCTVVAGDNNPCGAVAESAKEAGYSSGYSAGYSAGQADCESECYDYLECRTTVRFDEDTVIPTPPQGVDNYIFYDLDMGYTTVYGDEEWVHNGEDLHTIIVNEVTLPAGTYHFKSVLKQNGEWNTSEMDEVVFAPNDNIPGGDITSRFYYNEEQE